MNQDPFSNMPPEVRKALENMLGAGHPQLSARPMPTTLESVDFMGDAMEEMERHYNRISIIAIEKAQKKCALSIQAFDELKGLMTHDIIPKITSKRNVEWLKTQFENATLESHLKRPLGEQVFFITFARTVFEQIRNEKLLSRTLAQFRIDVTDPTKMSKSINLWKELDLDTDGLRTLSYTLNSVSIILDKLDRENAIEICEYILTHTARGRNFLTTFPTEQEKVLCLCLIGWCVEVCNQMEG